MSSNDYIKYITEQFVKYVDTSKEERKNQRKKRKSEQDPMLARMFGIIPIALMLIVNGRRKKPKM
ncbi:MAG TPA: YqzE family protein [Bacillus bacterium]|nr:YqzE family protein [Bacillus sp. (in: firmicutes)]